MTTPREDRMLAVYSNLEAISRRGVARNRREAAPLTVVQHTLLMFVATTPGCRAIDVAAALRLNRSTVSRQVGDLTGLGLVRTADEPKGRGQVLELTPRGDELLATSLRANQQALAARLEGWTDDEIDVLARGLERFNAADPRSTTPDPA
ncbi:MarR family winged helix-turn-helix transcriptional regulator [Frondihabitans cladoniiphilus]|uniref:MarR family winged helix-turn-helix transcriptional regulator n=1 Tax=Frondihabitans cladoniiphilus TaxID=715785 RepID=A0ABP8W509_9MICO